MKKIKSIEELNQIIIENKSIVLISSLKQGVINLHLIKEEYNQAYKISFKKVLSSQFFYNQPKIFFEYYKKYIFDNIYKNNFNYIYLKKLEIINKLKMIIDFNIDGLYLKNGFTNVIQLYGNIHKNYCSKCHKEFSLNYIKEYVGTVRCDECNGLVKPSIVLPNEIIDKSLLKTVLLAIEKADLLFILDGPINVYPISDFIKVSKKTLLITSSKTSKDILCDYIYYGDVFAIISKLNTL